MLNLVAMAMAKLTITITIATVLLFLLLLRARDSDGFVGSLDFGECPTGGGRSELDDNELSSCFTQVFHNELLPHLREGIPQLGIISIDPVVLPKINFTLLNESYGRIVLYTENVAMVGGSNMTRSNIVVNTTGETIKAQFGFSSIELNPARVRADGNVLGLPLRWFLADDGGRIVARMNRVTINVTFGLRNTPEELFKLQGFEYDSEDFVARSERFMRAAWIENVGNWITSRFARQLFAGVFKPGFHDACEGLIKDYMNSNLWRAVVGDFL